MLILNNIFLLKVKFKMNWYIVIIMDKFYSSIGLVLQGGGARGAYQAGVLKAIAEINSKINNSKTNPFPIISGTSVGALNACALVGRADDFTHATQSLETLWRDLTTDKIFDPRLISLLKTIWRFLICSLFNTKPQRYGWFDNRPMRKLLQSQFNRAAINKMREQGAIDGFCITSSCYKRGVAISFFESNTRTTPWQRARREGEPATITIDHIMASAALPCLFPAVRVDDSFHGDGALRLTEPLSPAIRLGATKLLAIGVRDAKIKDKQEKQKSYPSATEMLGYAFDILFNDNLESDIERLARINKLLSLMEKENKKLAKYKNIDILVLQPSQDLCQIALQHEANIPYSLKLTLKLLSAGANDGRLSSYMLFEPKYIHALIELGYKDTLARANELKLFLKGEN